MNLAAAAAPRGQGYGQPQRQMPQQQQRAPAQVARPAQAGIAASKATGASIVKVITLALMFYAGATAAGTTGVVLFAVRARFDDQSRLLR